jgi:hypothetical protein
VRILQALLITATLTPALVAAPQKATATREDADRFNGKVSAILANGSAARPISRRTQILERELNAYIAFDAKENIPAGVVNPTVTMIGDGRVGGNAEVDLDQVRTARKRGMFDPLGYLSGRLPVSAVGMLTTKDGVGHFTFVSAEISGVPIPKVVLQELVSYYSRSPERPDGINLDDPFELPVAIRQIDVAKGEAVVVQ